MWSSTHWTLWEGLKNLAEISGFNKSSWCLNQPIWKICSSNWDHFPRDRGKKSKNMWVATTEEVNATISVANCLYFDLPLIFTYHIFLDLLMILLLNLWFHSGVQQTRCRLVMKWRRGGWAHQSPRNLNWNYEPTNGKSGFFLYIQGIVEPRKKPSYFPLYWLVNRDPYNGLL